MRAFCYASGLIEFGRNMPDGALPIARGPAKVLRPFIEGVSRHGYQTEVVQGRPTKVPGTEHLLVPGIPEAPDDNAKVDALQAFCAWIGKKPPQGVTVF